MIVDIADLANMLGRVADLACDCLAGTPTGAPAECRVYHGLPPDDLCCDFLAVWLERLYPAKTFPTEWPAGVRDCGSIQPVASIAVKLRRPCWPTVTDTPPYFPPSVESETAAANLAIDATRLWCCLFADLTGPESVILGSPNMGMQCAPVTAPVLTPGPNLGGCAGWLIRFSIGLDGCCSIPIGS